MSNKVHLAHSLQQQNRPPLAFGDTALATWEFADGDNDSNCGSWNWEKLGQRFFMWSLDFFATWKSQKNGSSDPCLIRFGKLLRRLCLTSPWCRTRILIRQIFDLEVCPPYPESCSQTSITSLKLNFLIDLRWRICSFWGPQAWPRIVTG